ncbi:hypothetical protein [Streptomyces sp. NPDC051016]|uniref:hypothetical protein n=1 Tax=Streptomyces sp. NPDC051016 TaxID=3365638 RepID=UPI0037A4CAF8
MTAYKVGYAEGQWTVWIALGLAAVWVATGRWRDYPSGEGRNAEQLASEVRRRSRLVNRSILAVASVWILTNIVVDVWAVRQ